MGLTAVASIARSDASLAHSQLFRRHALDSHRGFESSRSWHNGHYARDSIFAVLSGDEMECDSERVSRMGVQPQQQKFIHACRPHLRWLSDKEPGGGRLTSQKPSAVRSTDVIGQLRPWEGLPVVPLAAG